MSYEVDFLAVGVESASGDAICFRYGDFVQSPGSQTVVVIDGGFNSNGDELVDHIRKWYDTNYVDIVISSHPDADHVAGLRVVLEKMEVGTLAMHLPWSHSDRVRHLFVDGRITDESLSQRFRRSLEQAHGIEQLAREKGVNIVEPFAGTSSQDNRLLILGPSEEYYEALLPDFGQAAQRTAASGGLVELLGRGVQAVLRKFQELWNVELLVDPAEDATSPRNNSCVVVLAELDDKRFLFTADAGVPALELAANYADSRGIDLRLVPNVQVPHHGSKRNVGPTILNRIVGAIVEEGAETGKRARVSAAAKGRPKHPSQRVVNAFIRRGVKVTTTEGSSLRTSSHDVGDRPGWTSATPESFQTEYDDED